MKLKRNIKFKLKDKFLVTFILISLIVYIIMKLINKETIKVLEPYLESDMKKQALDIINTSIIENNNKSTFNDLIITDKNSEGEIIGVDFDTLKVNKILTELNKTILDNLRSLESGDKSNKYDDSHNIYKIPFYIFSNNIYLRNLGFNMPFKIKIISNNTSHIKTDLSSYGINNALVKMYVEVNVYMQVIMPYLSNEIQVETEVPVMMKIINGRIPEVYGGMYSINSHSVWFY